MTSAAAYICSGHHGEPCGHTASNHGGLGCTACGCKHSEAFVMYQWALHELAASERARQRAEKREGRISLTYGIVGNHDGAYDWVRKEDYDKPEYALGRHDGGIWDAWTVYEVAALSGDDRAGGRQPPALDEGGEPAPK